MQKKTKKLKMHEYFKMNRQQNEPVILFLLQNIKKNPRFRTQMCKHFILG